MSLFLLLASLTAQADELSVSPAWLDVDASSGTTVTQMLTIGMSGRGARQVRVYTGDWTWEDGRSAFPPTGTSERSAELSVDATTLWVDASEPTQVPVQIHIPNVGAGATYGVIFVEEVVPDVTEDGGMITTSRIAVPVLVANGQPTVDIDRVDSFVSDEDSMLRVDLSLANNGVSHAQPTFRGAIRSGDGAVATFSGRDNRYLMPGQARVLQIEGPSHLAPGRYELMGVLVIDDWTSIPVNEVFVVEDP
ncbi:MAG: hypothetical protein ACJAZO_005445, partial [Myxococcota bacterium]